MRKILKHTAAFLLALAMLAPVCAGAAQPNGYWPYHKAYTDAVSTGDVDEILKTGDGLLEFYSQFEMNFDIAANSFNVYNYRYANSIFEKRGDYAAARENLEKLLYVSEIAGIKDMNIPVDAKMRKINTHTDVFALTSSDEHALYYGAKNEPRDGVYYGRVLNSANGVLAGKNKIKDESIVSMYLEVGQSTARDFSWLIEQVNFDGKALQVDLNFPDEGNTVKEIISGQHDANIRETLEYLDELHCPVFLRIGAEMNVWTIKTDSEEYKSSYIRIANMARSVSPDVALIFSVDYASSYGDDMALYYPGDEYVDWVGVSLYYNRYQNGYTCEEGQDFGNMFFGAGDWAEPVASIAEVVEKFGDRKPIMITEGGVGHYNTAKDLDLSDFASDRITQAYRTLTMVYPQIKGIVYFDADVNGSYYHYDLEENEKTEAAYSSAVAANKTLLHSINDSAMRYVSLGDFCEKTDSISLSAYCYAHYSGDIHVDYYLDGSLLQRGSEVVHECTLDTASLSVGTHTFTAVFSDGANFNETKKYHLVKNEFGVVEFADYVENAPALSVSSWALPEVTAANNAGLVPDFVLSDFTANITRSQFCTLVMTLLSKRLDMTSDEILDKFGKTVDVNVFTDTKSEDVLVANALGILNGRGNGIFDPDSSISREEAAVMLYNAAKLLGIESTSDNTIADADSVSSWAGTAVSFVSSVEDKTTGNAVMGGVGGSRFNPKGTYTKEQAILTMIRLFRA